MVEQQTDPIVPAHQWTNGADKVLILRCDAADDISHRECYDGCPCGGASKNFKWPAAGEVVSPNWSPSPDCASGGLFGWPWGIGFGIGKEPDYTGRWRVFTADPGDVVDVEGKCKARRGTVVFVGMWYAAMTFIRDGQRAWIAQAAQGASSATGYSSASSAAGDRSIAANTGQYGRVEAGAGGLAVSTAADCYWTVRQGATFVQRWSELNREGGIVASHTFVLEADAFNDGDVLHIVRGEVVSNA